MALRENIYIILLAGLNIKTSLIQGWTIFFIRSLTEVVFKLLKCMLIKKNVLTNLESLLTFFSTSCEKLWNIYILKTLLDFFGQRLEVFPVWYYTNLVGR